MKKKVLILSFPDDFHALAMQKLLEKHSASADIVDAEAFPAAYSLTHSGPDFTDVRLGNHRLSDYHCIWLRRVLPPRPEGNFAAPEEQAFAARECTHAFWGALYASQIPMYNDPQAERRAGYKPYQLRVAHQLGFTVPETMITSDANEARAFAEKHPHLIYKGLGTVNWMMLDTRPLAPDDLNELWRVEQAPVIFQEYLERGREYRVSLVEDDIFAGEILLNDSAARYDWRLDDNHNVLKVELSAELGAKLTRLLRILGLNSGAIDLRETPDGRIYFLEINPAGQFLFLDIFGGLDVGNRFCEMLLQDRTPGTPISSPPLLT